MTTIQNLFDDKVIRCGFWPPRSPNLNPCDFYLQGTLKSEVYTNKLHSLVELKQNIWPKLEPFWKTNCGELLDMFLRDVQPAKDIISNINGKLDM